MSNITEGRVWAIDTKGIITHSPVWIRHIIYVPSAVNDDILFNEYQTGLQDAVTEGTKDNRVATITLGTTITAAVAADLPADILDGYIFHIRCGVDPTWGAASANNDTKALVTTAGDGTIVVCSGAGWTNEAAYIYSWATYPTWQAFLLKAGASDASPIHLDYGPDGRRFQNLICQVIDGGTVYLHIM